MIFIPMLILIIAGLLAIYSSTINHPRAGGNFEKQFIFFVCSMLIFFVIYFLPQQTFRFFSIPSYLVSLFFLVAVLAFGRVVYGSKSWFGIGGFGFQPSELAKLGTILFLAFWLSFKPRDINNIKDIGFSLLIGFIPIILIMLEPDTGTAIVFFFITLALVYWSGINLFGLFVVLSPGVSVFASILGLPYFITVLVLIIVALFLFKRDLFNSAIIFVVNLSTGFFFDYVYRILKPHQQLRIASFLDPNADPLRSGYNAIQAKVAIGSGGLFGKGFMEGNQTQLRFIPEQWTDFIFCVIGEEFGFIGAMIIIICFFIIFYRLLKLASQSKDAYSSLVTIGILVLLFVHFAINIGMNVGITPVIGLPLPFLSYGGSALLIDVVMLGIAMNFYRNRKQHT
jgi:rod shape determining protein RodA